MSISFIRTIIIYIFILFAVRLMGKRQISDLQTSELVVTLLISDIAAIPMQDTSQPIVSGLIPIAVLVAFEIILSFIMLKNSKIRKLVCGKPMIIINKGKIDQKRLRLLRISTEDLSEQLRQKDIEKISDVEYAVIETSGNISVIKKAAQQPITLEDLGIKPPRRLFETVVVSDGEFSDASIEICGKSRKWVEDILSKEGITDIRDVFMMTADESGKYRVIKKDKIQ